MVEIRVAVDDATEDGCARAVLSIGSRSYALTAPSALAESR